eukprot:11025271-Heterocapsa_arctica.AAC.1
MSSVITPRSRSREQRPAFADEGQRAPARSPSPALTNRSPATARRETMQARARAQTYMLRAENPLAE